MDIKMPSPVHYFIAQRHPIKSNLSPLGFSLCVSTFLVVIHSILLFMFARTHNTKCAQSFRPFRTLAATSSFIINLSRTQHDIVARFSALLYISIFFCCNCVGWLVGWRHTQSHNSFVLVKSHCSNCYGRCLEIDSLNAFYVWKSDVLCCYTTADHRTKHIYLQLHECLQPTIVCC